MGKDGSENLVKKSIMMENLEIAGMCTSPKRLAALTTTNVAILLSFLKQIANENPLCSTGNYTQYFVITYKGKESEKNRYVCMYN